MRKTCTYGHMGKGSYKVKTCYRWLTEKEYTTEMDVGIKGPLEKMWKAKVPLKTKVFG